MTSLLFGRFNAAGFEDDNVSGGVAKPRNTQSKKEAKKRKKAAGLEADEDK